MAKSPQLITYKVQSDTIPDIQKEIDIIVRHDMDDYHAAKKYFTEKYGPVIIGILDIYIFVERV